MTVTTLAGITFPELGLAPLLLKALTEEGYTSPTPIQAKAIPVLMAGRDVLGIAQTGTGKTAAFALPLLHRLVAGEVRKRPLPKTPRILVLTPTRELAVQVEESFTTYGRFMQVSHTVIFGGVGQVPQVRAMARGVDVLVATPGRLMDLMTQGHISLHGVEAFVLDEADRMLDMGFFPAIQQIVRKLPAERHTLLFSATMPEPIAALAASLLRQPERIEVAPQSTTVERIEQSVLFVGRHDKKALLLHMLNSKSMKRVLVFSRTKHGANRLSEQLEKDGVPSSAIHGNKSQTARQKALNEFRDGRLRVLVATDIAARGIDIDGLDYVINYDLPNEPESYVHRIGRTARAGASGFAASFVETEDVPLLRDIEKAIRRSVPIAEDHPYHDGSAATMHREGRRPIGWKKPGSGSRGGQGQGQQPRFTGQPGRSGAPGGPARSGAAPSGQRPAGAAHGARPAGAGHTPRPAGQGGRPANSAPRPAGNGPRNTRTGSGGH